MEISTAAQWLNDVFGNYDYAILSAMHALAERAGTFFTPFMKAVSVTGNHGALFIILAVLLILIPKTRKQGICMAGALIIGALITNVFIKNWVARMRPYQTVLYYEWWRFVSAPAMREFSFPSGHTTAASACLMTLWQLPRKRYWIAGFIYMLLMGMSRNYLMVHYPSDVLAAILIGIFAAFVSCTVVNKVYHNRREFDEKYMEKDT